MAKLSFTAKRIVSGVALVQMLFFVANYYWFHLFEPFDKQVLAVSGAIVGIWVLYFGPTVEELREHRDKKRSIKG